MLIAGILATLSSTAQQPVPAKQLPDFQFATLDGGRDFTPASLQPGRLTFFFFFDADCEHCQRAVSHLQDQLKNFANCNICLVSLDPPDKIALFLAAHAPVIHKAPGVILLRDPRDQFRWRFHPYHYPGMFLYSPKGELLDYEDNDETVFRITGSIHRWNANHHT